MIDGDLSDLKVDSFFPYYVDLRALDFQFALIYAGRRGRGIKEVSARFQGRD